jgi:tetratricopeptide (TPR) repeat protein
LIFLFDVSSRLGASWLDPHTFQLESKLIYLILSAVALGALLLFLLVSLFPVRSRTHGVQLDPMAGRRPVRKISQIQIALQLGNIQKAQELLSSIRDSDPDYWQVRKILGDLHAEKGQWAQALEEYREGLNHCTGQEQALLLFSLGNVFEQQDQIDQARESYKQALQDAPNALEILFRLRSLAVREEDWTEAMNWQEVIEQEEPQENTQESGWKIGIRYQLAKLAAESGNWKSCHALLKYISRMTVYFTPAYLLHGEIQEKQGNFGAAAKILEEGYARTQNPAILKRIAESFLIQNQPQRAIDHLREILRNHPSDPRAAFCLGDLYRKLEMATEATRVFESIRQKHPDWLLNNIALADLYARAGENGKALELYKGIADDSEKLSVQPWQCYNCNTTYTDYREFCVLCYEWNSVNLNQNKAGMMDFKYEKSAALPL